MAKHKRPYPKETRKCDPQQARVYRMESEALGHCGGIPLSDSAVESLVRAVCRNYSVPDLQVLWIPQRCAAIWHGDGRLTLSTTKSTSRDLITITHELAHQVHHHASKGADVRHKHADHGPEFMACHMSILDSRRIVPLIGMRAVCDDYGIKYAPLGLENNYQELVELLRK